ncbi:hypothetical protein BT69DRAFT_1351475 [Atractiella rhizophila]|nr:hypothetical protein BT69DRAFT_1351475 [Atractiella rhizophila]
MHPIFVHPHLLPLILCQLPTSALLPLLTLSKSFASAVQPLLLRDLVLRESEDQCRRKGKLKGSVRGLTLEKGAISLLSKLSDLFPTLTTLSIRARSNSANQQYDLHLPLLSHLEIQDPDPSPRTRVPRTPPLPPLLPTSSPGRLQSLTLISLHGLTSDLLVEYLRKNSGLRYLTIAACEALDARSLVAVGECRLLKELRLRESDALFRWPLAITAEEGGEGEAQDDSKERNHPMSNVPLCCPNLSLLEISGLTLKMDDLRWDCFAHSKKLYDVSFARCPWITELEIGNFRSVRKLRIASCPKVKRIPVELMKGLEVLSVLGERRGGWSLLSVGNLLELWKVQLRCSEGGGGGGGLRTLSLDTAESSFGPWNCQYPIYPFPPPSSCSSCPTQSHAFPSSSSSSFLSLSIHPTIALLLSLLLSTVFTSPLFLRNTNTHHHPTNHLNANPSSHLQSKKGYEQSMEFDLDEGDEILRPYLHLSILSPHLPSSLLLHLLSRFQSLEDLSLFGTHLGGPPPFFRPSPVPPSENQNQNGEEVNVDFPGTWKEEWMEGGETDRRRRYVEVQRRRSGGGRELELPLFEERMREGPGSRLTVCDVEELKRRIKGLGSVWV